MPVQKISDAPANIRELDDVKLTLSQINWILNVYDGLKNDAKVDSPMGAAIAQFKKSFEIKGGKWVKKESSAQAASRVDLEHLDRYHIVTVGKGDPASVADLRELEGDFGPGVYVLWSDEKQSVIAFAFEKALFDEAEAQEWVRKAMEKPESTSVWDIVAVAVKTAVTSAMEAVTKALALRDEAKPLRSFDEVRRLVHDAIDAKYLQPSDPTNPLVEEAVAKLHPWIVDLGPSKAIVEIDNERFAIPYYIGPNDVVTLGEAEEVTEAWIREDGSPIMLHAFSVHLGDGTEAEDDEEDGLIWKELIHPGKWFKTDTGRVIEITAEMIGEVFRAWTAGFPKLISVPTDSHHDTTGGIVPVEKNKGFVAKLKLLGDKLFGGFKFTEPEVARGVAQGNIADCSVYLQPNMIHPETGEEYEWTLEHVLLTNAPLVQDLMPFGSVPVGAAAGTSYMVQSYQQVQEVETMTEQTTEGTPPEPDAVTLSAAEAQTFEAFQALNLSVEDVQAMAAEREQVRERGRDLEITRVVRAMEGVEEHPGITQVEGFRHYPVVCAAVETALRERPQALALSVNEDGTTGIDELVFEIVNAIPEDGRMALQAQDATPAGRKEHNDPTLEGGAEDQPPSDEQISEFAKSLNPKRGSAVSV